MRTTLPRHSIDTHPDTSGQPSVITLLNRENATGPAAQAVFAAARRRLRWTHGTAVPQRDSAHAAPFAGDDAATVQFPRIVLIAAAPL